MLDKVHSQPLYKKIKDLQPRGNRIQQMIKDKNGMNVREKDEILNRWCEYVEELYDDRKREEKLTWAIW